MFFFPVPAVFPTSSLQVPNMFPKFPTCFLRRSNSTSVYIPYCLAVVQLPCTYVLCNGHGTQVAVMVSVVDFSCEFTHLHGSTGVCPIL